MKNINFKIQMNTMIKLINYKFRKINYSSIIKKLIRRHFYYNNNNNNSFIHNKFLRIIKTIIYQISNRKFNSNNYKFKIIKGKFKAIYFIKNIIF